MWNNLKGELTTNVYDRLRALSHDELRQTMLGGGVRNMAKLEWMGGWGALMILHVHQVCLLGSYI